VSDARWRWLIGVVVLVAAVAALAGQMVHVHAETGRWALSTAAPQPPFSVHYDGRVYEQGDAETLPRDAVRRGSTKEGAPVYMPAGDEDLHEMPVIYVTKGEHAWLYGLVGGP
jgi:enterochelin esterase-like enzyme